MTSSRVKGHVTAGFATAAFAFTLLSPALAAADEVVVVHEEGSRLWPEGPWYAVELEPHFSFGAGDVYGSSGFGGGLRASIPVAFGHLGRVPQNLAISFGGDILHYGDCYYSGNCGANYLMVPIAAQWNIFLVRRFSLFVEGGAYVYKGWFNDECGGSNQPGCNAPSDFGVLPTGAVGGRLHLAKDVSLTLRLGYPMSTIGVSFM